MVNTATAAARICVAEPLTVRGVQDVQAALVAQFSEFSDVELDIHTASVDCSGIQLIEAARRHAREAGKQFRLVNPASGELLRVLEQGGFMADASADDRRFWHHEGGK
jgi:hypothetical protein